MKNSIRNFLLCVVLSLIFTGCASSGGNSEKKNLSASVTAKIEVDSAICDENATAETKLLYNYLKSIYGKNVLTGQMENAWNNDCNMLNRVYEDTGKYPALMGFDFMNYTGMGYSATNFQTEWAIKFWNGKDYSGKKISENHGIVAFMWHWRDPCVKRGMTGAFNTGDVSNDKTTTFKIPYDTENHCWNTETNEYKRIIADLDIVAKELLKLQNAGVPVLWRPLHEGAGNLDVFPGGKAWFWWGAGNNSKTAANSEICGECYIALWRLMFTYFTEEKEIHNLIWVWNGQNEKFYPGNEYVDLIGDDIYGPAKNYSSQKVPFEKFQKIDMEKPVALTECGNIPDMENIKKDEAWWLYFMVWNDGSWDNSVNGLSRKTHRDNFWSGTYYNTQEHKNAVYNSEVAITLDEIPDFCE